MAVYSVILGIIVIMIIIIQNSKNLGFECSSDGLNITTEFNKQFYKLNLKLHYTSLRELITPHNNCSCQLSAVLISLQKVRRCFVSARVPSFKVTIFKMFLTRVWVYKNVYTSFICCFSPNLLSLLLSLYFSDMLKCCILSSQYMKIMFPGMSYP